MHDVRSHHRVQGHAHAPPWWGFYLDLKDEDFEAQFCIYHRRFSTNTVPKWPWAQPMRFLGHNGEINTLQGNLNWMASKEADMTHPVWDGRDELRPICNPAPRPTRPTSTASPSCSSSPAARSRRR